MTNQHLKDYEKVQSLDILKLWTSPGAKYEGKTLETLPLECAISDMQMLILDSEAELFMWEGTDEVKLIKDRVKRAKAFLKKYAQEGKETPHNV